MQIFERYNSIGEALRRKYGTKVYKLALESGTTCPNRDGTLGTGGCSFCSAGGSGDFASGRNDFSKEGVIRGIDEAILKVSSKLGTEAKPLFIPYFQSYSATYAPVEVLRERFTAAISHPLAAELALATRPDCIGDDVLELLVELSAEKPVTVEMGLQTADDKTAEFHGRKCGTKLYAEAVERLNAAGIGTVLHMIVGLPCPPEYGPDSSGRRLRTESISEIMDTVDFIVSARPCGIKIHLLHVLSGTRLCGMYKRDEFRTLELEEYADTVCRIIERLPPEMTVHRLTGDAPKRLLAAPMWSADKKNVLNTIARVMDARNTFQGKNALQTQEARGRS